MNTLTSKEVNETLEKERDAIFFSYNRMIGGALIVGWVGVIIYSLCVSAGTWSGDKVTVHPHVSTAIFLGFLVAAIPGILGLIRPYSRTVPYFIAVGQMLLVGLLTHMSNGRIEMHFAYFGSLALLASYREWRVIVIASAVAAVDHLVRGLFMPYSVFGSDQVQVWRVVEHAFWVIWEDVFLVHACLQGAKQLRRIAEQSQSQQMLVSESASQVKDLLLAAESLGGVSNTLSESAKRLMTEASNSLTHARNVAAQMNSMSARVSEMDVSSQTISKGVDESSSCASQSDLAAERAMAEVSNLIESSQQISEVLDTVQALVFQTNLLSINASIEAARAGEAGASFAVVASEVRHLADQSRESAETIGQRISTIQKNVETVGSRLSEICDSVRHISQLTSAINSSTQTQSSNMAAINQSTAEVNIAAQQMVQSLDGVCHLSETASAAALRTSDLSEALRKLAAKTSEVVTSETEVNVAA